MALPNLSNSMYVAHLRYIQTMYELGERRNPDTLVRHFIPLLQRMRSAWLSRAELASLREDPFYYYLVARTKYYDTLLPSSGWAAAATRGPTALASFCVAAM